MDGCQECLRESRGDRVMTHDERTWHVQILVRRVYGRWKLSTGTVLLLWRFFGLQCSISRTTWTAASRTSTSRSLGGYRLLLEWVFFRHVCISRSPLRIFYFFQGRCPSRVEFTFLHFKPERYCMQLLSGLLRLEEARFHTNPALPHLNS